MDIYQLSKGKSILVIGDVMLDRYYGGDVERISPEAPVPVFRKQTEQCKLGGAANVAANLAAASQHVSMMTMVGRDEDGDKIIRALEEMGIDTSCVFQGVHATTVKTRFLARNHQQLMRMDVEETDDLTPEDCTAMLSILKTRIDSIDLIVLSDYLKGVLTYAFTQGILRMAREHGVPTLIDVKDKHMEKYDGAYLLKPNLKELQDMTNMVVSTDEEIIVASQLLRDRCHCAYVLTTCGARGMILVGETIHAIDSVSKEVYDVTGAGDTTIAYLSACLANGIPIEEAVNIANLAAGVQVAKVGTSAVRLQEVVDAQKEHALHTHGKLLPRKDAKAFRETNSQKKIVFTNGCFDILHVGHIRYLQQAATLGDLLVVGLNSDVSVRRLKGEGRPINGQEDRAELLCALDCVDEVVIFDEDTPYALIGDICPDVLVKGGDYKSCEVIGRDIVEAHGGKLVLIDFVAGKSTTNVINKIKG